MRVALSGMDGELYELNTNTGEIGLRHHKSRAVTAGTVDWYCKSLDLAYVGGKVYYRYTVYDLCERYISIRYNDKDKILYFTRWGIPHLEISLAEGEVLSSFCACIASGIDMQQFLRGTLI